MEGWPAKVVVTDYDYPSLEVETRILGSVGATVVGAQCKTEEELIDVARDADGLLVQYARVGGRTISHLERCLVIARYGIGVDIVDVEAATRSGILVTNVPDYCVDEVADHAIAMFLCLVRGLREYDAAVRRGRWHWSATGTALHRLRGQIAGVVGFGKIGRAIAARLKPFGLEVIVSDPYVEPVRIESAGCRRVDFGELLHLSDIVFVQAPLTHETRHLFDRAAFAAMKRSAILVNTARGPIVDNDALLQALTSGTIRAAALDDLEEEPAKQRDWMPDNPLLGLENLLVSPHSAYYSEEAILEARETASQEVARVLSGIEPRHIVNRSVLASAALRFRPTPSTARPS